MTRFSRWLQTLTVRDALLFYAGFMLYTAAISALSCIIYAALTT